MALHLPLLRDDAATLAAPPDKVKAAAGSPAPPHGGSPFAGALAC
jgi:hypothetical protein